MAAKYSLIGSISWCALNDFSAFPFWEGFWGKEEVAALSLIPAGAACPGMVGGVIPSL